MNRAHASVQYATEVGRRGVSSPDPARMPFQPALRPSCASNEGEGGEGDVESLPQRPLIQARPAERLRFTKRSPERPRQTSNTTESVKFSQQRGARRPRRLPVLPAGTRMTTMGFIRGSGLPVSSRTLSTIHSQIPSKSTLNPTAEHHEGIEASNPVVSDCTDVRLTGTVVLPLGLSAHASLDLRGSQAAGLWHTASHGSVELVGVLARVTHSLRSSL